MRSRLEEMALELERLKQQQAQILAAQPADSTLTTP